jgi:hypothetical protein
VKEPRSKRLLPRSRGIDQPLLQALFLKRDEQFALNVQW